MGPGDAVFWHADLVHSVESEHRGREHSSVLYIPAGPDCAINRDYLRRARHAFALGASPPDFPKNDYEVDYRGRATPEDLTEIGRAAMGWTSQDEEQNTKEKSCQQP